MQGIGSFFDKFKNKALEELKIREVIMSSIQKNTKQQVSLEDINIKEGIITVKGNQTFKSELFLKKALILGDLSKKITKKFVDIR